ncbi:MAG: carnitine dehydratase [Proteobacteria bacterium SG_bin5]|nr:MAG: carnitine dehydratase [Proteobacteria bacterium SG_bin5]
MMGPLAGIRIVEFAGIGPGPFAAMMLADNGADVVRIDRPGGGPFAKSGLDLMARGRRSIALDLKAEDDRALALALIARADGLIEGNRPGVMERLGLGPAEALAAKPALVYGRMTGWGQSGPLAPRAGHDLNYLALTGALHAIGPADRPPPPPLNLIADFGGGAMLLAFGMLAALLHARASGVGQVVDAAMIDGVIAQTTLFHAMRAMGAWGAARGANLLDGGAPFYRCYACACGGYVAVGAIEPQFFALLRQGLGLADDPDFAAQHDRARWPAMADKLASAFAAQPRDHWAALFAETDACVTPVLRFDEVAEHPHLAARQAIVAAHGVPQPAPAPRYGATPTALGAPPPKPDADRASILNDWGIE